MKTSKIPILDIQIFSLISKVERFCGQSLFAKKSISNSKFPHEYSVVLGVSRIVDGNKYADKFDTCTHMNMLYTSLF